MALFSKNREERILLAPTDGRVIPLESVPDAAFAQKMIGDGFAILPTGGQICSPADGVVENVSQTGHAVTLLTGDGLELLIHVGIDTVSLGSAPFSVCVHAGQAVKGGDVLLQADLEMIRAASLPTDIPVLVTNRECLASLVIECRDCIGGQTAAATYRKVKVKEA